MFPMELALYRLAQEFIVPAWFTGAIPVLVYAINAGLFKVIEQAAGEQLPDGTKRLIVGSMSLVAAILLVAIGQSPLPFALPAGDSPVEWFTFFGLATSYIFAGATVIYALIDTAMSVMKPGAPSLPEPPQPVIELQARTVPQQSAISQADRLGTPR